MNEVERPAIPEAARGAPPPCASASGPGSAAASPGAPGPARVRGFVVPLDTVSVPVAVDDGEVRSGLPGRLRELGLRVDVRRLPVGDVAIGEEVVIERKTTVDLLASLDSGRLFTQARRLRDCARPLVVIEGDPWELIDSDKAAGARGALLTLLTGYRIPVAQTGSLVETAACIAHVALQAERRARRLLRRRGATPQERQALAVLEALPDVGPARARALYRALGSVAAVAGADVEALADVPGIGRVLAARLVAALTGRRPATG